MRTSARASARACRCSLLFPFTAPDDDDEEEVDDEGEAQDIEGRRASIKASSEQGRRVSCSSARHSRKGTMQCRSVIDCSAKGAGDPTGIPITEVFTVVSLAASLLVMSVMVARSWRANAARSLDRIVSLLWLFAPLPCTTACSWIS